MRMWIVDAFADRPFRGNPAVACLLPCREWPGEAWMLDVAAEMRASETAFVLPQRGHEPEWGLRWFTPVNEALLCGHATLAATHALRGAGLLDAGLRDANGEWVRYCTRSGVLRVRPQTDGLITLDFPAHDAIAIDPLRGLQQALGGPVTACFRTELLDKVTVLLASERAVRDLAPDMAAISRLPVRSVTVTAVADDPSADYDFVSRTFCPAVGIPEDPVTGGAHTVLAPFWAGRLGRAQLTGYQASARGGLVVCDVRGDRVMLSGQAVTVATGTLLSQPV
ncbi:PhzF family phenazine biosynthesis protein [Knoellia sp. CPCC 206453]|uniref:PhzF family phenazine biosynthesis protein n=1 Tax=Knoellia pratensis TaxID=3404796 RepID=UPI003622D30C